MTADLRERELLALIEEGFRRKVALMPGSTPKEKTMTKQTDTPKLEQIVRNGSVLLVRKGEAPEDVPARLTSENMEAERARVDAGESVVS